MVATAASAAFSPIDKPRPKSDAKTSGKQLGGTVPASIDARGLKSKPSPSANMQVKVNTQAPPKVHRSKMGFMDDEVISSSSPRTFINQLPDWSMLLAAITTIFLAAEKQWMMLDWKPKRSDSFIDSFGLGGFVQDGSVFRQNFSIRSYEIGADRTASIETMMNHLQETALNHVKSAGLLSDGFGSTPEMYKKNLIWVVSKMQVLVDRYPTWGDVVQVDTWVAASGKNGMRRDWVIRDSNTGDMLMRASSLWVMMNKETRKLAKMDDEVRAEIGSYFVDVPPVIDEDGKRLPKLDDERADYVRTGLTSAPLPILESHELASMTLEYRRECRKDSTVQSLTSILGNDIGNLADSGSIECQHLLRLEGGTEIVKGRTEWRPKLASGFGSVAELSTESG
ncbi:PREDICTED: palmitoyl-acyl carrier protein thioesterase, chloroplastic-like isoform X2 [Ipomoea nil]|uniref:palmitoyl-acyl carrier protein thioesterase, chloroplastic-like isoform X2 n=1 Tax=Ipomoea nil TaxID=35883 RepID=UPI0009009CF4|nr:PREDICTED: palmitoyl-acyl carrier protein thioesterase, chloroplastic-like isoform X2 [Ipomoea nil]